MKVTFTAVIFVSLFSFIHLFIGNIEKNFDYEIIKCLAHKKTYALTFKHLYLCYRKSIYQCAVNVTPSKLSSKTSHIICGVINSGYLDAKLKTWMIKVLDTAEIHLEFLNFNIPAYRNMAKAFLHIEGSCERSGYHYLSGNLIDLSLSFRCSQIILRYVHRDIKSQFYKNTVYDRSVTISR